MINFKRSMATFALLLVAGAQASQQDMGQGEQLGFGAEKQVNLPNQELTSQVLYEYLLGEMAVQRGKPEMAAQLYLKLAIDTRDPRLANYAAHLAFETRQMDQAMTAFNLWLELEPSSLLAKQALATLLISGGKLESARPHLEGLIAAAADKAGSVFMRIWPMIASYPDKGAALNLLRELTKRYPQVAEAHWTLAQVAEVASKHELAIAEARQALALRPEWDSAVLLCAELLQQSAPKEALATLKKYLDTYPETKEVRLFYARVLIEQKKSVEARAEFQQLLAADHPDGSCGRPSHDSSVAVGFLGSDGGVHHGWAHCGNGINPACLACDVCGLVQGQTGGSRSRLKSQVDLIPEGCHSDFPPCFIARVAKLVDAPGLGPDVRKDVRVRVPPRAPT